MKKILSLIAFLVAMAASGQVGVIVCGTNLGTGFLVSSNYSVVTCLHVIRASSRIVFTEAGSTNRVVLEALKEIEGADIAVLRPVTPITTKNFMKIGSYEKTLAGEAITITGEDNRFSENPLRFDLIDYTGKIVLKGHASFNQLEGDVLEIFPFGRPRHKPTLYPIQGYSGSPVLNEADEVIGVVSRIYWTIVPNNENSPVPAVPRLWAVSIDPIKPFVK